MYTNVFYFYKINDIGGIETFYQNLAEKYRDRDITIVYNVGAKEQIRKLAKKVRVMQWKDGMEITCKRAFFNFNLNIIDHVHAEEYFQIIHGDYKSMQIMPNRSPKIDTYLACSQVAADTFEELTGEKCKVKVDRLVKFNRRWYVVDYKTTLCAETFRFNSDIFKLGYHLQAAMYTEGVMVSKKLKKRPGFLFVAQEKKAPYSVNVIEVSEEVMGAGIAKFRQLMDKYHECRVLDKYPGYVGDIPNDAFLPTWMQTAMEDEFE